MLGIWRARFSRPRTAGRTQWWCNLPSCTSRLQLGWPIPGKIGSQVILWRQMEQKKKIYFAVKFTPSAMAVCIKTQPATHLIQGKGVHDCCSKQNKMSRQDKHLGSYTILASHLSPFSLFVQIILQQTDNHRRAKLGSQKTQSFFYSFFHAHRHFAYRLVKKFKI